jgi:hypothetical protein
LQFRIAITEKDEPMTLNSSRLRFPPRACGVLSIFLLSISVALAQVGTASIRGSVSDPGGALVPNAKVAVKNVQTAIVTNLTTDAEGRYVAPGLPIGQYEIEIRKEGFESAIRENVVLAVGDQREINFSLRLGQSKQEVVVQEQAAQLETATSTVAGLITPTQMRDLPLNGRNFEQLIVLTPGVVPVTNAASSAYIGRSQVYSFAGARPVGQEEQLDGQDIQDFWDRGTGAAVLGTSLGVDSIAEFQTYTSTASAQFGGANGGVNAVTRSGGNTFHGSAYEFARNQVFDANPYFVPSTGKPDFERNQFGGTLGGPIRKNKMFFFFNYEGLRQTLGETPVVLMPNQAARTLVTNYLSRLTPNTPASINERTVLNALNSIPLPPAGSLDLGNGTSQAVLNGNQHGVENYFVGRWDYNISSRDSVWVRSIYDRATLSEPFAANSLGLYPQKAFDHNQFHAIGWNRNITSNLISQMQFNYTRTAQVGDTPTRIPGFNCNALNGYDCYYSVPGLSSVLGLNTPTAPIFNYIQNKFEPREQLFWVKGGHSLSVGAWVLRNRTGTNTPVNPAGNYYFSSWGYNASGTPAANSFLSGQPFSFIGALPGQAYSYRDFRETDATGFIQDDWKIAKNLTLNIGLRYAFESNPIEVHTNLYAFLYPLRNIDTAYSNVVHPFIVNPSLKNFDPRIGIAWSPFNDAKTVFRAGFGIVHDVYQPRSYGVGYNFSPPFNQVTVPFPAFTVPIAFNCTASASQCTSALPSIHDALGYDIRNTPYIVQYSANLQRELPGSILLSVGYLGSQSSHLLTQVELNPPISSGTLQLPVFATQQTVGGGVTLVTNPRINPNFGDMGGIMPWAHASYNALQVQANKSLSKGLLFQANWTFSHCLDNGSATYSVDNGGYIAPLYPYSMSRNRGNCSFDRQQNISTNVVYTLPFHGNRLVEGWQITNIFGFHTGLPFTVLCGFDCVGLSEQNSPSLPNINAGVDYHKVVQTGNINRYYNPAAFSLATLGTIGNEGRNSFFGPSLCNDDLAIVKNTRLKESLGLQIRAEAFNIFNHPNFSNPNTSLYTGANSPNPSAGRITSTISASGGLPSSRQLQFAVKLIF